MRIVGGAFRGKRIITPTHTGTRPTSDRTRETIFNILLHNPAFGPKVVLDKAVLDIFAGTGALGLEAFSRGAKSVTFIENDPSTLSILQSNVKSFDLPTTCILKVDALHVGNAPSPFELVFLDPPYNKGFVLPVLNQLLEKGWLSPSAVLVIEIAKEEKLDLPSTFVKVNERLSGAAKILFVSLLSHTSKEIQHK